MEIKDNLHERRQDRSRSWQKEGDRPQEPKARIVTAAHELRRETMPPAEYRRQRQEFYDERWNDPEFVWKQREKELLAWYGADTENREYGGGADRGSYGEELKDWSFVPTKNQVWKRLIASFAVFALVFGIFHANSPWAEPGKRFVTEALTREMDTQVVAAWYHSVFNGSPSFLPAFGEHKKEEAAKVSARVERTFMQPVRGIAVTPYSDRFQGVILETAAGANVRVMDSGRIVFAGNREDTGYTIVVQHAGGYRTTYGYLQPAKWEVSDWLNAGDVVGTAEPAPAKASKGRLFLSVMKEQRYLNPADVVDFD